MTESNDGRHDASESSGSGFFTILAGILILAVSIGLYFDTYNYSLVFDDAHIITHNNSITSLKDKPSGFLKLYVQEFWEGSHETGLTFLGPKGQALYRPVMLTFLGAVYYFWGNNPTAFHILNIILYGLVCLSVFVAVKKLFSSTRIAFFAGLLFACHPIHTESVSYATGAGELLGALFFILALIFYMKASYDKNQFRLTPYLLSLLFYLIGLFSKEHVITLIGIIVLYDLIQLISGRRSIAYIKRLGMYLGYLGVIGVNLAARFNAIGSLTPAKQNPVDNVTAAAVDYSRQLFTALKVLTKGIWMTIFPTQLSPDYSYAQITLSKSPMEAEVLSAILFILVVLLIALFSLKRRPLLSFGILWHFITIFVVSNIVIVVGTIFGERLLFLPSLGFCLVAAFVLEQVFQIGNKDQKAKLTGGAAVAMGLLVVLAGAYSFKTLNEKKKWENEEQLWTAAKEVCPNSAKVRFQMGQIYANNNFFQDAENEYKEALKIDESFILARVCLAKLYANQRQFDKAIMLYELIRDTSGEDMERDIIKSVRHELVRLYAMKPEKSQEAIEELIALKEEQNSPAVNLQIGDFHLRNKEAEKAIPFFQEAWDLAPERFEAAYRLLSVYALTNQTDKELALLEELEKKDLKSGAAFLHRAQLHVNNSDTKAAFAALDKAMERDKEDPRPYLKRAEIYKTEYRYEEALKELDKAIEKFPPQAKAGPMCTKMYIYMLLNDFKKAQETAHKVEQMSQHTPKVKAALGEFYFKQKKYPEAERFLREAIGGGVNTQENYSMLALALMDQNKCEDTVQLITPAVEELKYVHVDLYRLLGQAYITIGEYQKGVDLLKQTLKNWGKNPWIKYQIAIGELELKNYAKAKKILTELETISILKPLIPYIRSYQARLMLEDEENKNPEEALKLIQGAIDALKDQEGVDMSDLSLILANALKELGKVEEALKTAEEALKASPNHLKLKTFVDELKNQ